MRIALAQIDARLGDIEGICARIGSQAALAHDQGADLLCVPAPLMTGLAPGSLTDNPNYEHALIAGLRDVARQLETLDMEAIVPAPVGFEHMPLIEVFLLRDGRVIPLRSVFAAARNGSDEELWLPPVFDVRGVRLAVTFDVERDVPNLPTGCDLALYIQTASFQMDDEATTGVAAVADGHVAEAARSRGVWVAHMAPVGGFDDAVFTGGSYVMDDAGRVVSMAPCFEEALLVQEIERGRVAAALETHELPQFRRETWLWEALRLHLRDSVEALGRTRAVVALAGDLPSSLAAVLAVDALGSRNVVALVVERAEALTPAEEEAERTRRERARALARALGVEVVERGPVDAGAMLAADLGQDRRTRERLEAIYLEQLARERRAAAICPLTKTDIALAAPWFADGCPGDLMPFGDVYLTELEFLARERVRAGSAIPQALVTLGEVEACLARTVRAAAAVMPGGTDFAESAAGLLGALEPAQVDGALEAHVERGLAFEDIPLASSAPEALTLLLMLVRAGEAARRRLPLVPTVSARSFAERHWPVQLAWSDTGRATEERLCVADLVSAESERIEELGEEHARRVRGEVAALLGSLLGLDVADLDPEEIESELMRRMQAAAEGEGPGFDLGQLPPGMRSQGPHGFPFFSQN